MADDDTEPAPKRGPGRPRKAATPAATPASTEGEAAAAADTTEPAAPKATAATDPRIGTLTHDDATQVGFEDGAQYRCEEGVLVERLS